MIARRLAALWRRVGQGRDRGEADHVLRAARATMRGASTCVLASLDAAGRVDARVLQPFPPDRESLAVWLGTSPASRKARQVAASGRATLVYTDARRGACVTLEGPARLEPDLALRRRFFRSAWWAFFPAGPEGDDYVLLRCEPEHLEVVDFARRVTPPPFGLRAARLVRRDGRWQPETPE